MGWFEQQIKQRKQNDEKMLDDSYKAIADAINGVSFSRQSDKTIISKAAINSIIRYFGYQSVELEDSIKEFYDQLEYLIRPCGLMYREVNIPNNFYKDAFSPFIAFRKDDGTPVAFIPSMFSGYKYFDIDSGEVKKVKSKTMDDYEDLGLCFFKPLPLRKINTIDLVKYALSTWSLKDVTITLGLLLFTTSIGLLLPTLSHFLYEEVVKANSISLLMTTLIFMLAVFISTSLIGIVKNAVSQRTSAKMNSMVESATMMRIFSLPANFFRKYSSGNLSSRTRYVSTLCNTIMNSVIMTTVSSLFSLANVVSIFSYAPSLVAPCFIMIAVTTGFSILTTRIQTKVTMQNMELSSKESGLSYELISGIQKIKLTGSEKRVFAKWANLYAQEQQLIYNPPLFVKINSVISLAISSISTVVMYYIALEKQMTIADYYAFQTAYSMMSGTIGSLVSVGLTIAQIKPTLNMAKPILEAEPEVAEGKKVVSDLQGGLELNNVSFRYEENMPWVLKDLTIKIKPGQYVAVVGKTGCGKSTLIRLLLGFEKAQKGGIYFDGKDIESVDLKSLRRNIGVVMQNGKLFTGDIFSNITISAPWSTMDEAWQAAEIAGIADDIREMPMGMHTLISEGSGGISGGQKQRLMIARAIASKAKILIFDEATSALDNITQKKVSDSLDNLNCTRIVIAHRLSTIRHCDRILYLEDGNIQEDGTYEELIKLNGKFAELVERQRIDIDSD